MRRLLLVLPLLLLSGCAVRKPVCVAPDTTRSDAALVSQYGDKGALDALIESGVPVAQARERIITISSIRDQARKDLVVSQLARQAKAKADTTGAAHAEDGASKAAAPTASPSPAPSPSPASPEPKG